MRYIPHDKAKNLHSIRRAFGYIFGYVICADTPRMRNYCAIAKTF